MQVQVQVKSKVSLPHDNAYARLKYSATHGVGVFSIRDIPKGTNIFYNDRVKMIWVNKDELKNLDPEIKKLYEDFCVIKGDKYGCPENFNSLTVGWYINESKTDFNVWCTADFDFIAIRDIKKGEELLVDYSTYSKLPG